MRDEPQGGVTSDPGSGLTSRRKMTSWLLPDLIFLLAVEPSYKGESLSADSHTGEHSGCSVFIVQ